MSGPAYVKTRMGPGACFPDRPRMVSDHVRALGVVGAAALLAAPLCAGRQSSMAIDALTSLHRCGDETCLRITGHRDDETSPVVIAGRDVAVEGRRNWRVAIPLRTVRDWSSPFARSINVAIGGQGVREVQAALPIGLFSHVSELAFLDVSVRR